MQEVKEHIASKELVPKLRFKEFDGSVTRTKLGEVSSIRTGPFGSMLHQEDYVVKGTPIITVEHLSDQGILHENLPLVSDSDRMRLKSYTLAVDDIVFSRVGSVDRNSIISEKENNWLFSGRLLRIRTDKEILESRYLGYYFQLEFIKHRIRSVAVGQTMPSLNTQILKSFYVEFPVSISEQQKIASFLSSLDKKIQQLNQKASLLEDYKKGVMQQLFSRELRFKDENGNDYPEWEYKRFGEFMRIPQKIKPTEFDVNKLLTVKLHTKGLYKNERTETLKIGSTNYFVRRKGQFIYGKQNLFNGAFGIIPEEFDGFYTSGDIPALDFIDGTVIPSFILLYISRKNFYERLENIASGSGSKRIHESILLEIKIDFPCLEEQQKIATYLSAIDNKIESVNHQITQTQNFKKGMLQQMIV